MITRSSPRHLVRAAARRLSLALIVLGAAGMPLSAQAVTWTFDQTTTGQPIQWTSPTAIDPGAAVYNTSYTITNVAVTASYFGIPFGPFSVLDQIPPEQLQGAGAVAGRAPITIFSDSLAYPAPPAAPSVAALVSSGLDAAGHGFFSATNVVLGSLLVDLGFPFGMQTVQLTSIRIAGSLTLHATWFDEGNALAGSSGEPLLSGEGTLLAGEPVTLSLSGGLPGGTAFLVVGLAALDAPLKGGVLVPSPNLLLALPIPGAGDLVLPTLWPAGLPAGVSIYFQAWIPDPLGAQGFAASNGLRGVTP